MRSILLALLIGFIIGYCVGIQATENIEYNNVKEELQYARC